MVAGTLAVAGCGGGGGGAPTPPPGGAAMSAYDTAAAAIAAATTAAEVDSAVAGAVAKVSGADLRRLETAAAARRTALATMARATAQRKALMEAAGGIDTSDLSDAERIAAAKAAIAALKAALDDAGDVSDADRATYRTRLASAQKAVDRQEQLNAVMGASMTLATTLRALSDAGSAPTAAQVTAAEEALAALNAAVAAGGHLTEAQKARYGSEADQAPARIASAKTLLDAEDLRRENKRVAGIVEDITDTEIAAAMTAVGVVTDTSGDGDVTAAQTAIDAARARIDGADIPDGSRQMLLTALAKHEGSLDRAKASRLAHQKEMEDERRKEMAALAEAVYVGIVPYSDVTDSVDRRYAVWSDQGLGIDANATVNVSVGEADAMNLKLDKAAMVEALGGWKGARYKLEDEGTTYEAVVYDNAYPEPGKTFRAAWTLAADGWVDDVNKGTAFGQGQAIDGLDPVAGVNIVGRVGETYRVTGTFAGVSGEYLCRPGAVDKVCAVRPGENGLTLGSSDSVGGGFANTNTGMAWRFKPDNQEDRVTANDDLSFVTYGYWFRKGADGKWDVSAFHNANRGPVTAISGLEGDTNLIGTATYGGGAAGVYALSDGAGTFTADAELVADFRPNSASVPGTNSVTGTIDGFMTRGFTGGDGMPRDWSVELHKLAIGDGGRMAPDTSSGSTGLTRWTMDGTAAPAAGKWEGAFYERGSAGQRPKAATGSFYAEHGMSGRMVGAFGVTDPDTDEPLE